MTTFAAYGRGLSPAVLDALVELEMFIGDVDGKTTVISTDEHTCIDDGIIDAEEAVKAFNTIVACGTWIHKIHRHYARAIAARMVMARWQSTERPWFCRSWNATKPAMH